MIDIASLPKPPKTTNEEIRHYETETLRYIEGHNTIARKQNELKGAQHRSGFEELLAIFAPVLAVIALALRITKVTGELRLP